MQLSCIPGFCFFYRTVLLLSVKSWCCQDKGPKWINILLVKTRWQMGVLGLPFFLAWNKIWKYFIITLQHRQKEQCVLLCLNLTVSKEAENSWILEKWVYLTILKSLETALIPCKSVWKALLAVAELMEVKLPSEHWKGRIEKKQY